MWSEFEMLFTWCLGRPMIEGNTTLGVLSMVNPALQIPDPLSITIAGLSPSCIFKNLKKTSKCLEVEMG